MVKSGLNLQADLDKQRQKVDVDHFDVPVREIRTMVEQDELIIAPDYQRKFRWDTARESELIESILLGLPVPPIFVATNPDATWDLVDGLQRVSSIIHFVANGSEESLRKVDRAESLKLTGLKKLTNFNKLRFSDLPKPLQMSFNKRSLRFTALSDKSETAVRFDLFERLNRGGISLSDQEVRACIFRGPFNEMLRDLAESPDFRSLLKLQKGHLQDGTYEEQVLKFFAYLAWEDKFNKYNGSVTNFLNAYMEHQTKKPDLEGKRELFTQVVTELNKLFAGGQVVRAGVNTTPLNQFEALMVGAARLVLEGKPITATNSVEIMNDERLVGFSQKGTNTSKALSGRNRRAEELLGA